MTITSSLHEKSTITAHRHLRSLLRRQYQYITYWEDGTKKIYFLIALEGGSLRSKYHQV
jgi:hypothetical protein